MEIITTNTAQQHEEVCTLARVQFQKETDESGTMWSMYRTSTFTDEILKKIHKLRFIEKAKTTISNKEVVDDLYLEIINDSIKANIKVTLGKDSPIRLTKENVIALYNVEIRKTAELLEKKNHDYGEAWRDMRLSSITDLILMKLVRVKQIEDNHGKTLISEPVEANYMDIVNYAVFYLIRLSENTA